MTSSEKGPLARLVSLSWAVLLCAALLWAAVWLLQQIWTWLVALAAVTTAIWVAVVIIRWRRDRWLK